MTKRPNPFIEDFVQQSKVRVGDREFNNNEYRRQKVHEKTLELLFKGAKMPAKGVSEAPVDSTESRRDKFKQLFLGKDGNLLQSGVMVNHTVPKCPCGSTSEDCCSYCETALCGACQHPCKCCQLQYCSQCILTESEGSDICLSCYT